MSLFPFISTSAPAAMSTTLPLFKEYAWDFENNEFILKDGNFVILEGIDALKVWIKKALMTQRFRYLMYSWNYGNELENLVGTVSTKSVRKSEAKRYVEEALLINPYIFSIESFTMDSEDDMLTLNFTAITAYGEVRI